MTPVNPLFGVRELEYQIQDSGAAVAILSPPMYLLAKDIEPRLGGFRRVVRFGAAVRDADKRVDSAGARRAAPERPPDGPRNRARHPVVSPILERYLGLPKGVMLTHRNLVTNAIQFAAAHHLTEDDVVLNGLPVLLGMHFGSAIAAGATQVLLDRWDPRRLLALARQHNATHLYTVTPMITAFAGLQEFEQLRCPTLKFVSCGASSLDVRVGRLVSTRLQVPVVQGYGLTEASPAHPRRAGDPRVHVAARDVRDPRPGHRAADSRC